MAGYAVSDREFGQLRRFQLAERAGETAARMESAARRGMCGIRDLAAEDDALGAPPRIGLGDRR